MGNNVLKKDIKDGIGFITFNRADKLNALSNDLVSETTVALDEMEADNDVKVIILSGEGRAFCAGGDIDAMQNDLNAYEKMQDMNEVSTLTSKIINLEKYVITAVHGYAAGAGFSLALASDFIIATEDAKFALSFTNIGLIPDLGLIKHLTEIVTPAIAKEWISSGKTVKADEAYELGIVNRLAEASVIDEAVKFASFIVNGPRVSNQYVKFLVNKAQNFDSEQAIMQENFIQTILLQSNDHKEGVRAFVEKRKPDFTD